MIRLNKKKSLQLKWAATAKAEELEGRFLLSGSITGTVWNDANRDGSIGAREIGIGGQTVYIDLNLNNRRDSGELAVTTTSAGKYTFKTVPQGSLFIKLASNIVANMTAVSAVSTNPGTIAISTAASNAPLHTDGELIDVPVESQDAASGPLISLTNFRNDARFASVDGSGYSIVILDTGISPTNISYFGPDANSDGVADRIIYRYDFTTNTVGGIDGNGHGSNVASIAAGSNTTNPGMAPGANIIALKVLDDTGSGSFSTVETALQWCVANVDTYNIAAVNMSIGDSGNYNTDQTLYGLSDELASLASKNVIVASSAGNSYYQFQAQGVGYPAADPSVLAVGAVWDANNGGVSWSGGAVDSTSAADRIVSFSQRSTSQLDIFAPGAQITGAGKGTTSSTYGGTSQASPHVAGVAVLAQQLAVRDLGRRLTLLEFNSLLKSTGATIFDGDDENDNVTNTNSFYKRINVSALADAIEAMAHNGHIQGTVFDDTNGDGVKGAGEAGISSARVYVDPNNNGLYDVGETNALTDANGNYDLSSLYGTYLVRQVQISTRNQTAPSGGAYSVTVFNNQSITGEDFGNQLLTAGQPAQTGTPDLVDASDSGVSATDGLTNLNSATGKLLTFTIANTVSGNTVTLYADGNSIGTAIASGTSTSITTTAGTLADGAHVFTARQATPGGVQSALSGTRTVTVDTTAPTVGTLALTGSTDSGFSVSDRVTNFATLAFVVTGASYNRLFRNGVLVSNSYATTGVLLDTPSTDAVYAYTTSSVDAAGNASTLASQSVTVDRTAPAAPPSPILPTASDSGLSSSDRITNDSTPTFTISGGSPYLRVYKDSTLLSTSYFSGSAYTPTTVADGTYSFNVASVDTAGNESTHSATSVSIDTQAWSANEGSLDTSFNGGAGYGVFAATNYSDYLTEMAVQTDGKVVAVGIVKDASNASFFTLVRFNADGSVDSTFATNGIFNYVAPPGSSSRTPYTCIALQSDGRILVGGTSPFNYFGNITDQSTVWRFNTNGTLDTTFGTGGSVVTSYNNNSLYSQTFGIAVLPDGKFITSSEAGASLLSPRFAAARYTSNGVLDTTFGTNGFTYVDVTPSFDLAPTVVVASDGKIVLAGVVRPIPEVFINSIGIVRLNANGSVDTTFGTNGISIQSPSYATQGSQIGGLTLYGGQFVIQGDGKVVLGGTIFRTDGTSAFLMRLTAAGTLDTAFGSGDGWSGVIYTLFDAQADPFTYSHSVGGVSGADIYNVQLQPDGKIIAIGDIGVVGTGSVLTLTRYDSNGDLDLNFGTAGNTVNPPPGAFIRASVLRSDGTLMGVGGKSGDFLVARFRAYYDPSLLPSFDLQSASDSGISNTDNITNDSSPVFSINALPSGYYGRIYRASTKVGTDYFTGTTFTAPSQTDGTLTWNMRVMDLAGNQSKAVFSFDITIDTLSPTAPLVPDLLDANDSGFSSTDNITSMKTPTITVVGSPYYQLFSSTTLWSGNYQTGDFTTPTLADAVYTLTAKAVDAAGNISAASASLLLTIDTVAPTAPSLVDLATISDTGISTSDNLTKITTPTISVPGAPYYRLFSGGVQVTGDYQLADFTMPVLSDGAYTLTARSVDAAGNVSAGNATLQITVDTVAPSAPGVPDLIDSSDSGLFASDNVTNVNTPTFSVGGATYYRLYSSGSQISGDYQTTNYATTTLADGIYSMTAASVDTAGNVSGASGSLLVTIDTTAPTAPGVPDIANASDSGISNTDNITNVNLQTIGVAGAPYYRLYSSGVQVTGDYQTTDYSLPPLADGDYTLTAKSVDLAGNTSGPSTALQLTIDTVAPAAPPTPDLLDASDSGGSNSDNITNVQTPTLAAAGTPYYRLFNSGTQITGDYQSGNFTLPSLADGSYVITAKSIDAAGNASSLSNSLQLTVDTAAPVISSVQVNDGSAQRSMVNGITVTFNEAVPASSAIDLLLNSGGLQAGTNVIISNPLGEQKQYVLTFSGSSIIGGSLADGVYKLMATSAKTADIAGNHLASDYSLVFHRLFGDVDGDKDVDGVDNNIFRAAYGKTSTQSGYLWYVDYDSNSVIDSADNTGFSGRYRTKVVY